MYRSKPAMFGGLNYNLLMSENNPSEPPASSSRPEALGIHRDRIDEIDAQVVKLLNERARQVVEIGKLKRAGAGPIYAPDREQRVLQKLREHNQGPLPDACLEAIWRELMSGSFALERPLRIGYLGPAGSFSHLAATRKFGSSVEYDKLADIAMIFDAIDRKHIDYGLVPVENSSEGFVAATLDGLMRTTSRICAEVQIAVHHNLLANCDAPEIQKIYSHPQALGQCRNYLNAQFPNVDRVATSSTAKAAEHAANEPHSAAIASTLAGQLFNVKVQFENIEDNPNNTTRFYVLAHQDTQPTSDDKTALMFTTAHKAGALVEVLNVFQRYDINLTHIDKRPSQTVNWEYTFFIDLFGHQKDEAVRDAIHEAKEHCKTLKVLGSFPRAKDVL